MYFTEVCMELNVGPESSPEVIREEISKLKEEHASLDARIVVFDKEAWLSPDEQMERKKLQKQKLRTKDRIYALYNLLGESPA